MGFFVSSEEARGLGLNYLPVAPEKRLPVKRKKAFQFYVIFKFTPLNILNVKIIPYI